MAKNNRSKGVASVIVAQRAPHVATAEVVELFGSELAQRLYKAFAALNVAHFDGNLGSPLVLITQPSAARSLADYCARDVHGLESRIRIAPSAVEKGELYAFDVLLHEMVHAWQHEIEEDTENGYRGHGPKFARKCNEIGAELGLPPVGVKGRGGLPDCAHWPLNVRPAGYYGFEYKPATRSKKESKPAPESEPAAPAPASGRTKLNRIRKLIRELTNGECAELCEILSQELAFRGASQAEAAE